MTHPDVVVALTSDLNEMGKWPRKYLSDFPVRNQLPDLNLSLAQLRELLDRARRLSRAGHTTAGSTGVMVSVIAFATSLIAVLQIEFINGLALGALGVAAWGTLLLVLWERFYTVPTAVAYECLLAIYEDEIRLREQEKAPIG